MEEGVDEMTDATKQTIVDTAIKVAGDFGVPVVILAAFIWMAREAATTLHGTVVVPIVASHTEFLESTRDTLHEIGRTQAQQAETLKEMAISQIEIKQAVLRSGTKPTLGND
jgi:hypothetical protein